jgi:hypothetical protein
MDQGFVLCTIVGGLVVDQGFIQGLASRPIIHPSQQDLSMKLSC